jgi:hypothetical protein
MEAASITQALIAFRLSSPGIPRNSGVFFFLDDLSELDMVDRETL